MNEIDLAKNIIYKTRPMRKHLFVWQIAILIIACVASAFFIKDFVNEKHSSDEQIIM